MSPIDNPALTHFAAEVNPELTLAQVRILRLPEGFELRHVADRDKPASDLRLLAVAELRRLAQTTAQGGFRPLKSAPTLQTGWRSTAAGLEDLGRAVDRLYPGAIADWHAAQAKPVPVTSYREMAARQTGMYRLTQQLDDDQAARLARAVCHRSFCLKRRLWTAGGLEPEPASDKSIVPCLEPCAVLLECAREAARWEQEKTVALRLCPAELASLREALLASLDPAPAAPIREADFNTPLNPRRLRWILEEIGSS